MAAFPLGSRSNALLGQGPTLPLPGEVPTPRNTHTVCATCRLPRATCVGHTSLITLPQPDRTPELFALAREGKDAEFIKLFDLLATEAHYLIYEIRYDIGCASVDGKSRIILEHINKYYEKPFDIFICWVTHGIKQGDVALVAWMCDHIIRPGSEGVDVALAGGDMRMIKLVAEHCDENINNFDALFTGKATHDTIRAAFDYFDGQEDTFIKSAATTGAAWFLRDKLETNPVEVLTYAIQVGVAEVYATLTPPLHHIAFDVMVEQGKDELADAHFVMPDEPDDVFTQAAGSGCLRVLKRLPRPTPDVCCVAMMNGMRHDHVVEWMLTWMELGENIMGLLIQAARHKLATVQRLLETKEAAALPSLQPVLAVAASHGNVAIVSMLIETKRTDPADPELMTVVAINRDIPMITALHAAGSDVAVAFRNRVVKNDSDTVVTLLPLVSSELKAWALGHAQSINNTRMVHMLEHPGKTS